MGAGASKSLRDAERRKVLEALSEAATATGASPKDFAQTLGSFSLHLSSRETSESSPESRKKRSNSNPDIHNQAFATIPRAKLAPIAVIREEERGHSPLSTSPPVSPTPPHKSAETSTHASDAQKQEQQLLKPQEDSDRTEETGEGVFCFCFCECCCSKTHHDIALPAKRSMRPTGRKARRLALAATERSARATKTPSDPSFRGLKGALVGPKHRSIWRAMRTRAC